MIFTIFSSLGKRTNRMCSQKRWFYLLPVSLFLVSVYITATVPINSYDFWWHLKTGEYIIQQKAIPDNDPFTYTAAHDDTSSRGRTHFLLSQNWLSQVIYAVIVETFGLEAFIVFRGLLYTGIATIVLLLIVKYGSLRMSFLILALFIFSTNVALEDADRPQIFSFLWALFLIFIIEWAVVRGLNWLPLFSVPVMFLASNMHGGYLVGLVYLLVYLFCLPFEERLKVLKWPLLLSGVLACLITYLNPGGWEAVKVTVSVLMPSPVVSRILEHRSPVEIVPYVYSNIGWLSYWSLVLLSIPAAVYYFRKGRYSWMVLLIGTLAASLRSMRFIYFFVPISAVFVTVFLQDVVSKKIKERYRVEVGIATVVMIASIVINQNPNTLFIKNVLLEKLYPVRAAEFMAKEKLPQPVFNDMNWGGYLEWRLWPDYKMFIDTRNIAINAYAQYRDVMRYSKKGVNVLEDYHISTIIIPAINPYTGEIVPLVRGLYRDHAWSLAYRDGVSLIFVRKGLYHHEIPKSNVYYEVLLEVQNWRHLFPWARGYDATVTEALEALNLK